MYDLIWSVYRGNRHINKQIQPIANMCEKDTVEVLSAHLKWRSQERISTESDVNICYQMGKWEACVGRDSFRPRPV